MKIIRIILAGMLLASCNTKGVEAEKGEPIIETRNAPGLLSAEKLLEPLKTIVDKKEFINGLKIQWFIKGNGPALEEGEVYEINFKVKLLNGEVVDGNHLLKRDMIPFLVGYGMQSKGWDMAMKELHEGDFVEVYLPANLARGEKGIPGLIPPNSPNIIFLRIGKKMAPARTIDGVKIWKLQESEGEKEVIGEKTAVGLHFFVGTKTNPKYDNSYQRNAPFRFNMNDYSIVPGFRKALTNAKLYDKLWILVPAKEAYGTKGYLNLVKPGESVFYDIFVMEVNGKK